MVNLGYRKENLKSKQTSHHLYSQREEEILEPLRRMLNMKQLETKERQLEIKIMAARVKTKYIGQLKDKVEEILHWAKKVRKGK